MTNTMYQVSMGLAQILDSNAEFKTLCTDTLGAEFTYYVHVDLTSVDDLVMPYFSFVTYTDTNRAGEYGEVLVQMLAGVTRSDTVATGAIVTEDTQHLLEVVTKKAIEIIEQEMNIFGINGENGFIKEYLNIYAPPPDGEEDIQLQIDMILNTKKCL